MVVVCKNMGSLNMNGRHKLKCLKYAGTSHAKKNVLDVEYAAEVVHVPFVFHQKSSTNNSILEQVELILLRGKVANLSIAWCAAHINVVQALKKKQKQRFHDEKQSVRLKRCSLDLFLVS